MIRTLFYYILFYKFNQLILAFNRDDLVISIKSQNSKQVHLKIMFLNTNVEEKFFKMQLFLS